MPEIILSDFTVEQIGDGTFDWDGWTVEAALFDDSLNPDETTEFMSALSGEIDDYDTGYERETLTNKASTLHTVDGTNLYRYTADAVEWDSAIDDEQGTQVEWMVLYRAVTDDTDSPIIGYFQIRVNGSPVTLPVSVLEVPPHTDTGYINIARPDDGS